jgi:hypothetical protein
MVAIALYLGALGAVLLGLVCLGLIDELAFQRRMRARRRGWR